MSSEHDAVVVGAGPNGLSAANHLADAGWSVVVLEAQPEVGGAVRSDRAVHPDFVHDTFSSFYPLAAASPALLALDLERYGVTWRHAPAVLGHLLGALPGRDAGGEPRWALLHRDREVTAALMDEQHPGDGEAWLDLCTTWDRVGEQVLGAFLSPFPPVRSGLGVLARLPGVGGLDFVRTLLTPAVELGRARFGGEGPRILLAGNAGHADIPLDAPGSGLMGLLMTMLGQTVGFPVPVGGAGELSRALARRLAARGGDVHCEAEVASVEVRDGRAVGVRTRDGQTFAARHAVVADVAAPHLYGGLVAPEHLPRRTLERMKGFEMGPGTVKVDWALSGPIPWAQVPAYDPGTFHVADSVEQMNQALAQVSARRIPARPFMLAGQMTTTDPTRSPAGTESAWAYTHVPQETVADAGDGGVRGIWDEADKERFADRMQARVEELAPGFGERVLARRVLGPRELEARDANLIGGGIDGGTAQLHQQLVFRPVPGTGRAETPVRNLYLGSASAHPGGGVHGAAGRNAARAALAHTRLRRWTLRS